jgi:hypothetical protein
VALQYKPKKEYYGEEKHEDSYSKKEYKEEKHEEYEVSRDIGSGAHLLNTSTMGAGKHGTVLPIGHSSWAVALCV